MSNPYIPANHSTNEIAAALCKAQAKMAGAVADSTNPHFRSNYADLESIWTACRIPLTENGLSVAQTTEYYDKQLFLRTILLHLSGQSITGLMPVLAKDSSAQAMGSGLSYARRYALAAMVGVYQTDDDGEAAQPKKEWPKEKKEQYNKAVSRTLLDDTATKVDWGIPKSNIPVATEPHPEVDSIVDHLPITFDQVNEINKKLNLHGRDVARFNSWLKREYAVPSVNFLIRKDYEAVVNFIDTVGNHGK